MQSYAGQAAFRSRDWKLITGQPTCSQDLNDVQCPGGWVHLDGTIIQAPINPSWVWLFNITAEMYDLSLTFPDVVSNLQQRIEMYNATHVEQLRASFDPKSDPKNFGGVWTPWLG